jgi:mRNA interferase MazF
MDIRQGDILYADLSPVIGSEQGGIRPVVVVSNDITNKYSPIVTIAAVTSQITTKKLPTHVTLAANEYGLTRDAVILVEHVRTIDKIRFKELIGRLSKDKMKEVADAWIVTFTPDFYSYENNTEKEFEFILDTIISLEESIEYEFKEVKGNNPVDSIKSQVGKYATSFLNQKGGRIYWGIADSRRIVGVKLTYEQRDEIRRVIFDVLNTIQPSISASAFELKFHEVHSNREILSNIYVVELKVPIPIEPSTTFFLSGKELYVRVEGSTRVLLGSAIQDFILRKSS